MLISVEHDYKLKTAYMAKMTQMSNDSTAVHVSNKWTLKVAYAFAADQIGFWET